MAVRGIDAARRRRATLAFLYDARIRALLYQALTVLLFLLVVGYLAHNTVQNLATRGIASGFKFLDQPTGFGVTMSLLPYDELSSYGRAYFVGVLNTLLVAGLGVLLASVLGFLVGIARLSNNWLLSRLAGAYVELVRNVPLLLQILLLYFGVLQALPKLRDSIDIGGVVFINIRGIFAPWPVPEPGFAAIPVAFCISLAASFVLWRWARRRQQETGQPFPSGLVALALILGLPGLAALATGLPLHFDYPLLQGFNFEGGFVVIPELVALLAALVLYTAAFIAEVVRAGILAVSHGQSEAALSLGLKNGQALRFVVIPQAMRLIVPPLTSQYLNLTKNSSLAAAIGFPDVVQIFSGTVLNQTGQAIECVAMVMLVYFTISLGISAFMNWYNKRIALVER